MLGIFGKARSSRNPARTAAAQASFLARLARDTRGNMLAIMAAALIPFCGLVGGGIDLSRMYITKTRLQHACDAGALAGRKQMGGGTWGTDDNAAAVQYFDANFASGSYGSTDLAKTFTENAGKVSGTASAVLPMTLMRVLGKTTETLSVTCDAEMRLPNTDVMFVLDTTGSMNCPADSTTCLNNGGVPATDSKIDGLKTAVKCFYEIVARLDTDATCTTGTPSGGTGNQVQIRFGFMPYATNVNVGKLLPTAYFANTWPYQSREPSYTTSTTYGPPTGYTPGTPVTPAAVSTSTSVVDPTLKNRNAQNTCVGIAPATVGPSGTTTTSQTSPTTTNGGATMTYQVTAVTATTTTTYTARAVTTGFIFVSYKCEITATTTTSTSTTTTTYTGNGVATTTKSFANWHYGKIDQDISGLKNGTNWNSAVSLPIGPNGAAQSVSWDGCIEERKTVKQASYSPIPSTAKDLDIDLVPTQIDPDSLWGPALPGLLFTRNSVIANPLTNNALNQWSYADSNTSLNYVQNAQYSCPAEARKLQRWGDPVTFDNYVDGLVATGNTYHDIGMLWGARFMSPTGLFASENATTPQGGEIQRNMIFMTDGDTSSQNYDYNAYGIPWFDRRQTSDSTVPTAAQLNDQINARFEALCTAVKNKNITLWVISFGNGSNATTETRLSNCATTGRYFVARDSAALQSTFASIANQISQLRLTK